MHDTVMRPQCLAPEPDLEGSWETIAPPALLCAAHSHTDHLRGTRDVSLFDVPLLFTTVTSQ
jgi:hypothetical protein